MQTEIVLHKEINSSHAIQTSFTQNSQTGAFLGRNCVEMC